jgi:hypothetical protein
MVVPRVDEHIWLRLEEKVRSEDRYLQNLERLILQSQFALQPALEYFLKKEGPEEDKLLGLLQQSAKLSSYLNKKLVARRRNLIRPYLGEKYKSVAKKDLPITFHLFGEDLEKKVDNIDKTKDILDKPLKMKARNNKFARFTTSSPGFQVDRFHRTEATNNQAGGRPFLGFTGRRDRPFNQPPKKHTGQGPLTRPNYQLSQSSNRTQNNRFPKNYCK